ncbi:hypothetical protein ACIRD2_14270 [Streptomyces sp. NPDC093595]|uniref:hypothetical protein n=1 Tax=Streptomyces sp. NPDC093595 TaxID=3366045 RepID=UPI003821E251
MTQHQVGRGYGRAPVSSPQGRPPGAFNRFGGSVLVSMSVLFVETVLGGMALFVTGLTEPSPGLVGSALGVLVLPVVLIVFGAPLGFAVSVSVVLPLVTLSAWLGRRVRGRPSWWWVPAVAGAAFAVPVLGTGVVAGAGWGTMARVWLVGSVALAVPVLAVRPVALRPVEVRTGRAFGRVALYGTAAVAALAVLIGAGFGTGLLREYHPPRMSHARLVGTWTDGDGGTLRLAADGTATATGLNRYTYGDDFDLVAEECSGTGTWTYDEGDGPWTQFVDVSDGGCDEQWEVGGEPGRVTLYTFIGDPDSGDLYELTLRSGG